jgi:hypothetical protein
MSPVKGLLLKSTVAAPYLRCSTVALAVPVVVVGYCNDACYGCKADAHGKILMVLAGTQFVEFVVVGVFLFIVLYKRAAPFQRFLLLLRQWNMCRDRRETISAHDFWHAFCRRSCSCLRIVCCGMLGGREVATLSSTTGSSASCLFEISMVLADYFDQGGNELDVTPTDLVAGLRVVAASQRLKRKQSVFDTCAPVLMRAASLATGDLEEGFVACSLDETEMEDEADDAVIVSPNGTSRRKVLMVRRLQLRRGDDDETFFATTQRSRLLPGMFLVILA